MVWLGYESTYFYYCIFLELRQKFSRNLNNCFISACLIIEMFRLKYFTLLSQDFSYTNSIARYFIKQKIGFKITKNQNNLNYNSSLNFMVIILDLQRFYNNTALLSKSYCKVWNQQNNLNVHIDQGYPVQTDRRKPQCRKALISKK